MLMMMMLMLMLMLMLMMLMMMMLLLLLLLVMMVMMMVMTMMMMMMMIHQENWDVLLNCSAMLFHLLQAGSCLKGIQFLGGQGRCLCCSHSRHFGGIGR